ncbi:hypothetical protein [Sporomusa sphaeroides]|uniref:Chloroplast import component protein (Tic20) n=2 Tax=Sporomusa TaxID=2375 RepID=A0ABP2C1T6_9FIRM|nr:hypothetical protein [Sporomusa sphaeroides]OLS58232.1 hypothetical protein SPSPH_17680 [Sporomusa sphaeroides DSM 2875]CVK17581.1 hypothetical protein SSPH_00215 [Sporomusa sphaeroides DSM 2875]SCM80388.1 conserved membrane hypothetical protein [uncultured Sporomusa sp.]
MIDKPSLWSMLHPDLTARLLIVIIFLLLIAVGYAFGIYDGLVHNDTTAALNSFAALLLYAIPAFGLLKLKRWARMVELVLSIVFVIIGFIVMFGYSMTMGIITIVPHGLIAMYLLSDDCRRAFGLLAKRD